MPKGHGWLLDNLVIIVPRGDPRAAKAQALYKARSCPPIAPESFKPTT